MRAFRALLPHIVKFAYIPRVQLQIHGNTQASSSNRQESPDYSRFDPAVSSSASPDTSVDEDEHVLVLDFEDNSRGHKMANGFVHISYAVSSYHSSTISMLAPPPALTPAATKRLVEKRNERFEQAVYE